MRNVNEVPIWEKSNLTLEEAAAYSVSELPSCVQCPMTKTASSCCGMEQSG